MKIKRHTLPKSWPKPPVRSKRRTMAQAFDEWDRIYIKEPGKFGREWQRIQRFLAEGGRDGNATSQGRLAAEWLRHLMTGGGLDDWGA